MPDVTDVEVTSAVRSLARSGLLGEPRAEESLVLYLSLPLTLHATRPLLSRVWSLRHDFSAYDACYVALAEALGGRLLTADSGFAQAVVRQTDIEIVGM